MWGCRFLHTQLQEMRRMENMLLIPSFKSVMTCGFHNGESNPRASLVDQSWLKKPPIKIKARMADVFVHCTTTAFSCFMLLALTIQPLCVELAAIRLDCGLSSLPNSKSLKSPTVSLPPNRNYGLHCCSAYCVLYGR